MIYVLLTDEDNSTFLVACPDETTADAVGAAAIFNDGGVSAWRVPTQAVTNTEIVKDILNGGGTIAELFDADLPSVAVDVDRDGRPATYVSEETEQRVTIQCRWHDRPEMSCGADTDAVALRGQWQGGDPDVDPHWIPVCAAHDARWDVDPDTGEALPAQYQLPRIPLAVRSSEA